MPPSYRREQHTESLGDIMKLNPRFTTAILPALALSALLGFSVAQNQANLKRTWAIVPGFDCKASGCTSDAGAKIAAGLTTALINSKRFEVFEDEQYADVKLIGAITGVRQESSNVLFVQSTTVTLSITVKVVDLQTTRTVYIGTFEGDSSGSGVNLGLFSTSSTVPLDQAIATIVNKVGVAISAAPELQAYARHTVNEVPQARGAKPATPAATTPATTGVPAANASAQQAIQSFFSAIQSLNFEALNQSLTANFYGPQQLQAAKGGVNATRIATAGLTVLNATPAEQNAAYVIWDVVYKVPSGSEKSVRIAAINVTSPQLSDRSGWRVIYYTPSSPFRSAAGPLVFFDASSKGIESLLTDLHAAIGIPYAKSG